MVSTPPTLAPVVAGGRLGEQQAPDRGERLEVVHVVSQVRNEGDRCGAGAHADGLDVAALSFGDLVEVGEIAVAGLQSVARRASLGIGAPQVTERRGSG